MRIAILGSVAMALPPKEQASVEKLAYQQAIGLASRGHTVDLFCPDGSLSSHPRISIVPIGEPVGYPAVAKELDALPKEVYGAGGRIRSRYAMLSNLLECLKDRQASYDGILNNLCEESPVLATAFESSVPMLHVLHVPIVPSVADVYRTHRTNLISISYSQREVLPDLNYVGNVPNGVDQGEFPFSEKEHGYVLYLGSIGKNKNPKDAIRAAKLAGVPLYIGGKIKDESYYKQEILPEIDGKDVSWIGEVSHEALLEYYAHAKALLFPTLWNEPFGLVAIESLCCGTPVICYPNGGLKEIVEDGSTGFFCHSYTEMAHALSRVHTISRSYCRKRVVERYGIEVMIDEYEKVLQKAVRST